MQVLDTSSCYMFIMFCQKLRTLLRRRMNYNIRQAVPYILTFLVAFGISLGFWRLVLKEPDLNVDIPRKGNILTHVEDISKDLRSQLDYVHEQNRKMHRARNLAIDKMLGIQQQKERAEKLARGHAERAQQKDLELMQEREKYKKLKTEIETLKSKILRMEELQKLMEQTHDADEEQKERLKKAYTELENKLVRALTGISRF